MRRLLAWLGATLLLAAAPARDWSGTVGKTPAGAFVIGSPAAPIKLIEYVSYTCPHCAHFTAESAPTLRAKWVRSGKVSVEVRHFVIGGALDLSATVLARCAGPRFPAAHDAIYAHQAEWVPRMQSYAEAHADQLKAAAPPVLLRSLADGGGLTELVRTTAHLTPKAIDACFANKADLQRVIAMTDEAGKIASGTPSFAINGRFIGSTDWAGLEPQLRAAGAP